MQTIKQTLTTYQIDPEYGFLPSQPPLKQLPLAFAPWERLAAQLPALLMTERLRPTLDNLEPLETRRLENERQYQRAMLLLSVLGNAYVWGGAQPAQKIPRGVAIPWAQVAETVGRPMIVAHASMVLNNWRLLDESRPLALDNLETLQLFLGGLDERWFYLTTVAIEAKGGPALLAMIETQQAVATGQVAEVVHGLARLRAAIDAIYAILLRIPEKCDPHIFFHRIRPFLAGWPAPGVMYEGVSDAPIQLAGGSAAQSSLIQSFDAILGVTHPGEETRPFLTEMRNYMPPAHRRFIEAIEAGPSVRGFVEARTTSHPVLCDLYNDTLQALDAFRKKHIEISVRYILHQAPDEAEAVGTGGTSFVPFLSKARRETTAQLIKS